MNRDRLITTVLTLTLLFVMGCVSAPTGHSGGSGNKAEARHKPVQVQPDDATVTSLVKNKINHKLSNKANDNITVTTSGGIVTLTGTVPGNNHREQAEKVTRSVDGVRGIQNNLTIEEDKPKKKKDSKKAQ